jgi:hypothetical protein
MSRVGGQQPFIYSHIKTYIVRLYMKTGRLNLRLSENRLNKLRLYAQSKEKTVTQLVEDWIDRLLAQKTGDSSTTPLPNQPSS